MEGRRRAGFSGFCAKTRSCFLVTIVCLLFPPLSHLCAPIPAYACFSEDAEDDDGEEEERAESSVAPHSLKS